MWLKEKEQPLLSMPGSGIINVRNRYLIKISQWQRSASNVNNRLQQLHRALSNRLAKGPDCKKGGVDGMGKIREGLDKVYTSSIRLNKHLPK